MRGKGIGGGRMMQRLFPVPGKHQAVPEGSDQTLCGKPVRNKVLVRGKTFDSLPGAHRCLDGAGKALDTRP